MTPRTPEKQIAEFIAKFDPTVAKNIRACRAALRKRMPTANEMVYDNYNFFVIGYSSTERPSDSIVSLVAAKKGVGLCFIYGATLPDPGKMLRGSGVQTRSIQLPSEKTLGERKVEALLRAAIAQGKAPLPKSGKGKTIIRSISAKQRPRRA